MEKSIALYRAQRRRLQHMIRKACDGLLVRRAMAILYLAQGCTVSETARRLQAARSAVGRWRALWEAYGEEGLKPVYGGRPVRTMRTEVRQALKQLLHSSPQDYGYLRSRWSSELLARVLKRQFGIEVHASTLRRSLPLLGFGWRRARPTIYRCDPRKGRKLAAITRALARRSPSHEVFYVDEADVELNPRIGAAWMPRGRQLTVPTPGQNVKRYLAGALNAHSGKLLWVTGPRKHSSLFLTLLAALSAAYRRCRKLLVILDNYVIHKSQAVQRWLGRHRRVRLLFQPAWHPWVNKIERLWKALHDTVTRNHPHRTLDALMRAISRFMNAAQPFPGNGHALATLKL
jgi:transposase